MWTIDVDCASSLFLYILPFLTSMSDRRPSNIYSNICIINHRDATAQSRFLVSGSADNTLRLWSVQTGKCLYSWEFPTAVKRVAFSEDDEQVVCITEQRMGHQGAVRIFNINREGDGSNRASRICLPPMAVAGRLARPLIATLPPRQNQRSRCPSSTPSARRRRSARSRTRRGSS